MNPRAALLGQAEEHLCAVDVAADLGAKVHAAVVEPFLAFREAGRAAGFELTINSGFRGFERQCSIWNRKVAGELPVLDHSGVPIDITRLTALDLVLAILRWSALPGASRHHWGTDIDVHDARALPAGYEVELVPAEVDPGGMFGPLHAWIDQRIASGTSFGFFRPYDRDRGGIAPERWHLSYAPAAAEYEHELTADVLRAAVMTADMALKDVVLDHLDSIVARFVKNVNPDRP